MSQQISVNQNPLRCDPDLCWLMDEVWTTRFKVTIDAAPCRTPMGLADLPWTWLNRGDMGCETGMGKNFTKVSPI